jgi:hypothetical protein
MEMLPKLVQRKQITLQKASAHIFKQKNKKTNNNGCCVNMQKSKATK